MSSPRISMGLWGTLWFGLSACGAAHVTKLELGEGRLARAQQEHAEERAPELWQHFEEARRLALSVDAANPARADYETEARSWLEAAVAEAERIALSEARLRLERETLALDAQARDAEQARAQLARQAELRAAQEIARREADMALTRAASMPQYRARLSRSEVEAAASALLVRAGLVQMALSAWNGPPARVQQLEAQVQRARSLLAKAPDEALALADKTLFEGLAQLAVQRGVEQPVTPEQAAALAEGLGEAGARVGRNDRGLSAVLERAFHGRELTPAALHTLSRVCTLAQGYGRGIVQATVTARVAAQAEARASTAREALRRAGCVGERFRPGALGSPAGVPEDDLELTWLAY